MSHGGRDDPRCAGTWPITGQPCRHKPTGGLEVCAAHHPDGDQRRPPPANEDRCTATNKESGERCRNDHGEGGKVCDSHGGRATQVKRATAKRAATKKVEALVATYGLPVETTPEQAMLDEVHRTAGIIAWLEEQVRGLDPDELIWGVTKVKEGGDDRGTTEEAVPHALLRLYQQERAHLVKVCSEALRAGIEERQVKLAEQQGSLVAQVLRAILDDLNLTLEQKAMVPIVVPQHLRAFQATAATN